MIQLILILDTWLGVEGWRVKGKKYGVKGKG